MSNEQAHILSTDQLVNALKPYCPCEISDALRDLGLRDGYLSTPRRLQIGQNVPTPTVIAPAYTVQVTKDQSTYKGNYVDECPKNHVMVVSVPENTTNAIFGGLLARRASHLGAKGIVTDGYVRDIDEINGFQIPVFSNGTSIQSANGRTRISSVNQPIRINGVEINSGDMIVGDSNGVVVVPRTWVVEVSKKCAVLAAVESQISAELDSGSTLVDAFKKYR